MRVKWNNKTDEPISLKRKEWQKKLRCSARYFTCVHQGQEHKNEFPSTCVYEEQGQITNFSLCVYVRTTIGGPNNLHLCTPGPRSVSKILSFVQNQICFVYTILRLKIISVHRDPEHTNLMCVSVSVVRPTERPPLVDEASANFCG
jgi:hypothetical protein